MKQNSVIICHDMVPNQEIVALANGAALPLRPCDHGIKLTIEKKNE